MSTEPIDPDKSIMPTGKCFDDALELMNAVLKQALDWEPERQRELVRNLYLVHAVVKPNGSESSHAWLEHDASDLVYFTGILKGVRQHFVSPRGEYRRVLNVVEDTRYSYKEAVINNKAFGTYGPWVKRYQDLCRDKMTISLIGPMPAERISE